MALSFITSRCGNVSLMGLGLTIVGLIIGTLTVQTGTLAVEQNQLRDAMANAAHNFTETPTATLYQNRVDTELQSTQFQLLSFSANWTGSGWTITASGRWHTPPFLGIPGGSVVAAVP
ncbi:hypothetical protein Sulac_2630 [Sulfobacillus acidophilus DSM 10332]|uniref:Uncharacterized protein n=1 Tax=Sulfobacillus acidophilus (strain ATCC 700253 / DSM 10332 / NAL) TaxID=679936 RepID=G8TX90_SULAD|nr:hypothetical protein Sulac_2630 [Sulfobacillus acidophilus DSM 10332]